MLSPAHSGAPLGGDFANNPNTARFIDKMVQEHGFDRQQLHDVLAQARRLDSVLRLMDRQAPTPSTQGPTGPNGSWLRYRNKFITPDNVQNGVVFWNQYQDAAACLAGVRRAAGDHRGDYRRGDPLGPRNG